MARPLARLLTLMALVSMAATACGESVSPSAAVVSSPTAATGTSISTDGTPVLATPDARAPLVIRSETEAVDRARERIRGRPGQPARLVGVRLVSFAEAETPETDWTTTPIAATDPATPVWLVEFEDAGVAHSCPAGATMCSWEHVVAVFNAQSGVWVGMLSFLATGPGTPVVAMPPALPADARLMGADAAGAAAGSFAEKTLQGHSATAVGADLMTVRSALAIQRKTTTNTMSVFDPRTLDIPVWMVRLEGSSFHLSNCPSCPTGSTALITLRARDGAVYWIAVGSPEVTGQDAHAFTQVFPTLPNDHQVPPRPMTMTPGEMSEHAIAEMRQRGAIESGEPAALLSTPATPASLDAVGLKSGPLADTCQRPMYLVILRGDFQLQGVFPGFRSPAPARYVALTFDQPYGPPGTITSFRGSLDGAAFKRALNDPTLPDSPGVPPALGTPVAPRDGTSLIDPPCEDIWLSGV